MSMSNAGHRQCVLSLNHDYFPSAGILPTHSVKFFRDGFEFWL